MALTRSPLLDGHGQRNLPLPLPPKGRAGGGISLTRAGFMIIAPPFVTTYRAAEARSEDWFAHRRDEDSNPRPGRGRKLPDYAKGYFRTMIHQTTILGGY